MSKEKHSSVPAQHLISAETEPFLERVLFNNRITVLIVLALATLLFAFGLTKTKLDSSIEKYIPLHHEYIQNYLVHANDMKNGVANIKVSIEAKQGDIFTKEYQEALSKITDDIFYINGVNRSAMRSLWTPNTRWMEVTEEGFQGGPVIPSDYDGSPASIEKLRENVLKSGEVGRLVANDFRSAIIDISLIEKDPETGEKLNYKEFSHQLEKTVRAVYGAPDSPYNVYITGTPKKLGDLMDGAVSIAYFFLAAMIMTAVLLYLYSRCPRGTLAPILISIIAVVWQLGSLGLLGMTIDLYSVLVPFLVFAIGISHGVQIINGIAIEAGKGADRLTAARRAFRALYAPGMLALISDGMGFLTLLFIDIGVIRELAIAASLGVAIIIITNLVLLPIILSYVGISRAGIENAHKNENSDFFFWRMLSKIASPKFAFIPIVVALAMAVYGNYASKGLQIGDLDKGAPELRADSRYNLDNDFMVSHYSTSSDVFVVMVETPKEMCVSYKALETIDRFMWYMENVEGVQSAVSVATVSKLTTKSMNEGNLRWSALSRNQSVLNGAVQRSQEAGLINPDCSMSPVVIFLNDHKAETLARAVAAVEKFKTEFDDKVDNKYFTYNQAQTEEAIANNELSSVPVRLQLASGNAGIEAATNQVIDRAQSLMLYFVYAVVIALCFMTFRSARAVACIILPLVLTSILGEALMVWLGMGVKVATLPVTALGVGIGVDYGIYIYSRLEAMLIQGKNMQQAFLETLRTTGKAVAFTGITLAIGVATWIFSPIKFQADMGVLLTFMFLWNMLGALVLLPALGYYLLKPEQIRARHKKRYGDTPAA
jgi:predicted RND superfamily exporter protein